MINQAKIISRISRCCLFVSSVFVFSMLQFNIGNSSFSSFVQIPPAFANYGTQERNEGEFTFITYSTQAILNLSPKKIRLLSYTVYESNKVIFNITGFSTSISDKILRSLLNDVEFTKKLLRQMRKAKSTKERRIILERHKQRLIAEKKKLKIKAEANKRRYRIWAAFLNRIDVIDYNLELIDKWLDDLGEGT